MKTKVKTANLHDFVLNIFTSSDELRPALNSPGYKNDFVYSTDAHAAVRFKSDTVGLLSDYKKNKNYPDAEAVYKKEGDYSETVEVLTSEFLEVFFKCKLQFGICESVCDSCAGDGDGVCPCCNQDSECSMCEGTGTLIERKPFGEIRVRGGKIHFLGKYFAPEILYKIAHAALVLQQSKIKFIYSKDKSKVFAEAGPAEFLAMCIYVSE